MVRVFLGGEPFDLQPDYEIIGDSSFMYLGRDLATGDLNGDGYDDLIIDGLNTNVNMFFDYVRIYWGSAQFDTQYDIQLNDPSVDPKTAGFTMADIITFDYNLDGYDDLFVAGFFVYNGSATFDTIPEHHIMWIDTSFNAYGGGNLFNAGDINKDGWPDLAIGMPDMFGGKGLVHVRLGGNTGFDDNYIIVEPPFGEAFGESIINIDDLDGNGVSDLLIGEPFYLIGRAWGKLHFYSGDSTLIYHPPMEINLPTKVPATFQLFQNYPNPFNSITKITFRVNSPAEAALTIHDITGRVVKSIFQGKVQAGDHSVFWHGMDAKQNPVSSGIYFYRLKIIDSHTKSILYQTRKMLHVK